MEAYEPEPMAAKVIFISRDASVRLYLDDGRVVRVASMPDQLVDSLHSAYRDGVRVDYIVTGCSRLLAWRCGARVAVAALPAGELAEVRDTRRSA